MRLDGRFGDDEGLGDLGVRAAVGDQRQDLALACGQLAERGRATELNLSDPLALGAPGVLYVANPSTRGHEPFATRTQRVNHAIAHRSALTQVRVAVATRPLS